MKPAPGERLRNSSSGMSNLGTRRSIQTRKVEDMCWISFASADDLVNRHPQAAQDSTRCRSAHVMKAGKLAALVQG